MRNIPWRCVVIMMVVLAVGTANAARQKITVPGAPRPTESTRLPDLTGSTHSSSLPRIDLPSIADALAMNGVSGFVEGRARDAVRYALTEEGSNWICDSIANAINARRRGEGGVNLAELFKQDEALRVRVKEDLKTRIREWLPGQVKRTIMNDLFGGVAGEEVAREAQAIADRVMLEIDTSFNDRIDAAAQGLYDRAIDGLRREMAERGITTWVDIHDLRGSIREALSTKTIGDFASDEIAKLIGEGTVSGIRGRLGDALGGTLPPEVVAVLKRGPKEFEKYVEEFGGYLPGAQLESISNSVLNRPLFRLPTPAYASILAASAAVHFTRAFSGVHVDPYELKRGVEVTKVMVWQIQHKDAITLSMMQLANLAQGLASQLGAGADFSSVLDRLNAPLKRIQRIADQIDATLLKPLNEVRDRLNDLVQQIQDQLEGFQDVLLGPLAGELGNLKGWADDELAAIASDVGNLLPDGVNGLPGNWDEAKNLFDLPDDLLGDAGEFTPRDLMNEAARKTGLDEVARKVRDDLEELNEALSDDISEAASQALGGLHLLGPTAAILGVERVPEQNPSNESALDPVLLHNGEYVQMVTDIVIPGRGLDFRFTRSYRGMSDFLGELGWRWTHSFAERLRPWKGGITYIDGEGGKRFFRANGKRFESPEGSPLALRKDDDGGFVLARRDGVTVEFDNAGRPKSKCDRFGNCLRYAYGRDDLLAEVTDVFGRKVKFRRGEDGLIESITDFAGRTISFIYNDERELTGVVSPHSIDFPKGKRTTYRYTKGSDALAHLISMIMDPKGDAWLSLGYDAEGRVVSQRWGEGPRMTVSYAEGSGDVGIRTWVTDQLGAVRLYEHDRSGHLIRKWLYSGGEYRLLERFAYDGDGRLTRSCIPQERCAAFEYGDKTLSGPTRVTEHPATRGVPRVTNIEYEPRFGRIARVEYPDGVIERVDYAEESPFNPVTTFRKSSGDGDWIGVANYEFDEFGQPASETDARGVITEYEYYPSSDPDGDGVGVAKVGGVGGGYLKRIVIDARDEADRRAPGEPVRASTSFKYDSVGNIIAMTDPGGAESRYFVNSLNQVLREERPGVWPIGYRFDANDDLVETTIERKGAPVRHLFEYGSLDMLRSKRMQIAKGEFANSSFSYDVAGKLIGMTSPEGNVIAYEYDPEGRLACVVSGAGSPVESKECVERDRYGDVIAQADGSGVRVSFQLNGFGERIARTDGPGNRTEYERDVAGRIVAEKKLDSSGKLLAEERISWDGDLVIERSRRLWRDDPDKSRWISTRYEYDGAGLLKAVIGPLDEGLQLERDGLGNVVTEIRADGTRHILERDATGSVIRSSIESDGREYAPVEYSYDEAGRAIEYNAGWTKPWRFSYDGMGRLVESRDPAGTMIGYSYDDLGRTTRIARGKGVSEGFAWDGNGRLLSLVDANGNETRYAYDAQDRLVLERFADDSETYTGYDGAGRVADVTRRDGGRISIEYDAAGRMRRRIAKWMDKRGTQSFTYDGMGRLVLARDDSSAAGPTTTKRVYDSLSRIYGESSRGGWLMRSLDDAGRVVSMKYPGGGSYHYSYSTTGRVGSVLGPKGRLASFDRDAVGNVVAAEFAGRIKFSVERDPWGRPLSRNYLRMDGRAVAEWAIERDGFGRISSETDSLAGVVRRYRRDSLGRLIGVDEEGGASSDWRYEYDPAGNVLEETGGGGTRRLSYNRMNQIERLVRSSSPSVERDSWMSPDGTHDYEYDEGGRLTGDGLWKFEYDAWGRLEVVRLGEENFAQYAYDAFDRRVEQYHADILHRIVWDGWRPVRVDAVNDRSRDFVGVEGYGAPVLSIENDFPSILVADPFGSVRGIDGVENELSARCDYSPYGRELGCDRFAGLFGFAGQMRGSDRRLAYMRYRSYDPDSMRFIEPDPLGHKVRNYSAVGAGVGPRLSYHSGQGLASAASIPNRPLEISAIYRPYPFSRYVGIAVAPPAGELNLYQYASGDPSSYLDPFGLASLVFDRSEEAMTLVEDDGWELTDYRASNRTTNQNGDPMAIGLNGPTPDGIFAIGVPEFYSVEYRDALYEHFGLGEVREGETRITGPSWRGTMEEGYNISQGMIRMRVGAPTSGVDRVAWRRQLFIHGGRKNDYRHRTYGCIRARDDELETLAANFISFRRAGDAIDTLIVE